MPRRTMGYVYHAGFGRTGSDVGEGSLGIARLMGPVVAVGSAWTMFHKGW